MKPGLLTLSSNADDICSYFVQMVTVPWSFPVGMRKPLSLIVTLQVTTVSRLFREILNILQGLVWMFKDCGTSTCWNVLYHDGNLIV